METAEVAEAEAAAAAEAPAISRPCLSFSIICLTLRIIFILEVLLAQLMTQNWLRVIIFNNNNNNNNSSRNSIIFTHSIICFLHLAVITEM